MTKKRNFRLELSYNWHRFSEAGVYFLDHYCLAYCPASGQTPFCATFLDFQKDDEIDIFVFNRGITSAAKTADPQGLHLYFKQATDVTGSLTSVYGAGTPISLFPTGEASFELVSVSEDSWAFPNVTPAAWAPQVAGASTANPLVLDNVGSYLFRAVLDVEDPAHPNDPSHCRRFSFDPEMVVGEGTGGGGKGY